jgi:hypothetical protein
MDPKSEAFSVEVTVDLGTTELEFDKALIATISDSRALTLFVNHSARESTTKPKNFHLSLKK